MSNPTETCAKCRQKLVDRTFDKCMYCGQPIPENLRLSDEEKNKSLEEKQKRFEENEAAQRENIKRREDRNAGSSDSWWVDFGSGEGGFGDGGCGD